MQLIALTTQLEAAEMCAQPKSTPARLARALPISLRTPPPTPLPQPSLVIAPITAVSVLLFLLLCALTLGRHSLSWSPFVDRGGDTDGLTDESETSQVQPDELLEGSHGLAPAVDPMGEPAWAPPAAASQADAPAEQVIAESGGQADAVELSTLRI